MQMVYRLSYLQSSGAVSKINGHLGTKMEVMCLKWIRRKIFKSKSVLVKLTG